MKAVIEAAVCLLATILAASAWAEAADRDMPVQIEADSVRLDDVRKVSVYEGNVILIQGTLQLRADRIDVRQDAKGFTSGEATGAPVRFQQRLDKSGELVEGKASRLEYDAHSELFRMIGAAWLRRGEDEIRGNLITYNMRTEQYRAEGSVKGVGEGRVRAIIRPRSDAAANQNGKPAKP